VYPPANGATGRVLEYVAEGFVLAGWKVSVLVTSDSDTGISGICSEIRNGVLINRINTAAFSKGNILKRVVGYAVMIPKFCFWSLRTPNSDVVVTMTDPPMLLVVGVLMRLFKRSHLIHWVHDLYPEAAEALGLLSQGKMTAGIFRFISTQSMRCHEMIVVPGRCMKNRLIMRGVLESHISVIPNIGLERKIAAMPRLPNSFRELNGLGGSFIVAYSGNIGLAHEFETIIDAALILQKMEMSDVRFLFIGGGPRANSINEGIATKGLQNVTMISSQSEGNLSSSLGAADIHLVTMREGMSGLVVPSKLYGIMAASRPCIFVGPSNSEVALSILESEAGYVIMPGDAEMLVKKILELRDSSVLREQFGKRGSDWVKRNEGLNLFLGSASKILFKTA
jgi:glycosyltransferase involved in cell wall biosynthesis